MTAQRFQRADANGILRAEDPAILPAIHTFDSLIRIINTMPTRHRSLIFTCTLAAFLLCACSGGSAPEESSSEEAEPVFAETPDDGAEPGDIPVQLVGTLKFGAEEAFSEGDTSKGMSYSRRFDANCEFRQPAWMWTNNETDALEFRLREQEPGVLQSEFTGGAEASGDSSLIDVVHNPPMKETSTVRLRGALTECLIRQLETAKFGQGFDFTFDFDVALQGTVQTTTLADGATQVRSSGGHALVQVIERTPDSENGSFHLVNDPSNIGAHLHAAPLLIQPPLGERPAGDDPERKLQQEIYDTIVAHPETAWVGLTFDPEKKRWTFNSSHTTGSGAKHTLHVTIDVVPEREG